MTRSKQHADFLRELVKSEGPESAVELTRALALPELEAPAWLRARLLASAQLGGRLWRFSEAVADLLDVDLERARVLLDRVDDASVWETTGDGIAFYWVEGGPRVADSVRGFVRVNAGVTFPHHEHVGSERALVLQGTCRDSFTGKLYRPGELARMDEGTAHALEVPKGGVDLLKLAVVDGGVRIDGTLYGPRR